MGHWNSEKLSVRYFVRQSWDTGWKSEKLSVRYFVRQSWDTGLNRNKSSVIEITMTLICQAQNSHEMI